MIKFKIQSLFKEEKMQEVEKKQKAKEPIKKPGKFTGDAGGALWDVPKNTEQKAEKG